MSKLIIRTFGGFDMLFEDKAFSDTSIRRGKAWIALKFLIANYKRSVSTEELINILWVNDDSSNPLSSLEKIIYRLRKTFSEYTKNIQYISFSQGMYSWSPTVEYTIDVADFEDLLVKARDVSENIENRIEYYKSAIELYRGDFLSGGNKELWLVNFTNYYRRLYLNVVEELAQLYEQQTAFEEVILLHNEAIKIEPYEESLYIRQIRMLITIGDYALAKQQYQTIQKLLKKEFNVEPSPELMNLQLEIGRATEYRNTDLTHIKNNLENSIVKKSAIFCGPETFKRIYSKSRFS